MPFVAILSTIDTVLLSAALAPSRSFASSEARIALSARPQRGPHLPVVLAPLDVLPVCLEGGFRALGHGARILSVDVRRSVGPEPRLDDRAGRNANPYKGASLARRARPSTGRSGRAPRPGCRTRSRTALARALRQGPAGPRRRRLRLGPPGRRQGAAPGAPGVAEVAGLRALGVARIGLVVARLGGQKAQHGRLAHHRHGQRPVEADPRREPATVGPRGARPQVAVQDAVGRAERRRPIVEIAGEAVGGRRAGEALGERRRRAAC